MRSREMLSKLDRLSVPAEDDESAIPDISLLTPEDQDWVDEMFAKVRDETISEAEARKLCDLLNKLPILGCDDRFQGPDLEIPREIQSHFKLFKWHEDGSHHWLHFSFCKLRATQKVRFVELCRRYGWEGEYPQSRSVRKRASGRWGIPQLLSLSEWDPVDEAELRSMLDTALAA
jgi:hypothetical protein